MATASRATTLLLLCALISLAAVGALAAPAAATEVPSIENPCRVGCPQPTVIGCLDINLAPFLCSG